MLATHSVLARLKSRTFKIFFAAILLTQLAIIAVAWGLLQLNVSSWIGQKSVKAMKISKYVASSADWSALETKRQNVSQVAYSDYKKRLRLLSRQYFPQNDGAITIELLDHGMIDLIDPHDPRPIYEAERANPWEVLAYKSAMPTRNESPYSDDSGTYLGAYTPILRNGRVVGLLAVELDSATLSDLTALARRVFWWSIVPAILLSALAAFVFATIFIEPGELVRRIRHLASEATGRESAVDSVAAPASPIVEPLMHPSINELLSQLTPAEARVAKLAGTARTTAEIAEELHVSSETVKSHLRSIRKKTGRSKVDLQVYAQAMAFATSENPRLRNDYVSA